MSRPFGDRLAPCAGVRLTTGAAVAMTRIHLVDASIYVFRAWHVLPDTLRDADGAPANAVYGFSDFLLQLIDQARPTHLALAFDESLETSARHEIFPEYKANREPAPPELVRQFGFCRELGRASGLAEFASSRFEADDIVATIAEQLRTHGVRSTVVTGDKDLTQIVRTGDQWWDFQRERRLDTAGIEREFGVLPHRIADLLAIAGDRIDNIPGVPGVGRPTAARLIRRWNDLDGVLANIDGVARMGFRGAARVARLIDAHADQIRLARRLTGALHVPGLPASADAYAPAAPDRVALERVFDQLGFGHGRRHRWYAALETATRVT